MAYKTIKSLDQIRNIEGRIYVRWSQSIAKDKERGYSLAYGTSAEAGLSCCEITKDADGWESEDWRLIRQLTEYKYICGGNCWIITGDEVGTGEDNEPLLANVEVIGKASAALTNLEWRQMELDQDISRRETALSSGKVTDDIARKIAEKSLAKMKKERLEKYGY